MSIAAPSRLPSAYDLCWHLAQADVSVRSPSAARAFQVLHATAAQRGGSLGLRDLPALPDPLARAILAEALASRLTQVGADQGIGVTGAANRPLADVMIAGLIGVAVTDALTSMGAVDPRVAASDMDGAWLGANYASMLARRATAGGAPASSVAAELERAQRADDLRTRCNDPAQHRRFTAYRNDAASRLLGVAAVGSTAPEALAAARAGIDACLAAPYDEVARLAAIPAATDEAQRSAFLVGRLAYERKPAIIAAAAEDQSRHLGDLPVTRQVAQDLHDAGLLQPLLDRKVAVGVRSHSLISLANGMGRIIDHLRGKGVSSSPIVIAGMASSAFSSDGGHGDSLRTPEEHVAALTADMVDWEREAASTGRPLVIVGDGPDTAQAALATASSAAVPVAYVEVTMGGLKVLKPFAGRLPMDVFTIADAAIKTRYESDVVGRWIVGHTEANLQRLGLPGLAQRPAITLGYGASIGPGVAKALHAARLPLLGAVDVARASIDRAVADGFRATLRGPRDALPAAGVYFSCAGVDGTLDLGLLATMPDGAYVVNCASKGEIDRRGLVAAVRGQVAGVRARILGMDLLPEHRTLELTFADGRRVYVAKMGEPSFDGIIDKERRMVDMLMASILVSTALAARSVLAPSYPKRVTTLDTRWQTRIAGLIDQSYGR